MSGGARHSVRIDLPPHLPRVMADRRRIVQVLNNLLANAARHSPESSTIRFAVVRDGVHVAVTVLEDSDEGERPRTSHPFTGVLTNEDRESVCDFDRRATHRTPVAHHDADGDRAIRMAACGSGEVRRGTSSLLAGCRISRQRLRSASVIGKVMKESNQVYSSSRTLRSMRLSLLNARSRYQGAPTATNTSCAARVAFAASNHAFNVSLLFPEIGKGDPKVVLSHGPLQRYKFAGANFKRRTVSPNRLLKAHIAILVLRQPSKDGPEVVLSRSPVERHAFSGTFLERPAVGVLCLFQVLLSSFTDPESHQTVAQIDLCRGPLQRNVYSSSHLQRSAEGRDRFVQVLGTLLAFAQSAKSVAEVVLCDGPPIRHLFARVFR